MDHPVRTRTERPPSTSFGARFFHGGLAPIVLTLACSPPVAAALPLDHFLCYTSKAPRRAPRFQGTTLRLADAFGSADFDAKRPKRFCIPASQNGAGIADAATHLQSVKIKLHKGQAPTRRRTRVQVTNELGEMLVDTVEPEFLLVPTSACRDAPPGTCPDPVPPPDPSSHDVDHYQCYGVRVSAGAPAFVPLTVSVADELTSPAKTLQLKRPRHLCLAVDENGNPAKDPARHLACYQVKPAAGEPRRMLVADIHAASELGSGQLATKKEVELCVPSTMIAECNQADVLCDRRFDEVAYPTTHNAMSNQAEGWLFPNQNNTVSTQLADGVRALMLDTHYLDGQPYLCHEYCQLGSKPLVDGLAEIRAFLDRHPYEVVSIIFESYISAADTAAAFTASGLDPYLHAQGAADPWPTLRELISSGQRLIVFTDNEGGAFSWYLDVWAFAWETPFSFATPADFTCMKNRGNMANRLFILNHFLTQVVGSPVLSAQVNYNPLFVDRAEQCQSESGRLPNFVTVDFYDIGDLFGVVNHLNGLD